MKPGRIIGTSLLGFLFFLFIAVDLVVFGVVPLNSIVVTLLPLLGLVVGGVLGAMVSKRRSSVSPPPAMSSPDMSPPATQEI